MNLLADESVDRQVVELLRQRGHAVVYIAEVDQSISDSLVLERANQVSALLITADKDFGELVFREERLSSDGVILIRLSGLRSATKATLVDDAISEHGESLRRRFTVIAPGGIRFRTKKISNRQ
jgi:predicted nuclease of predicted toxin-antitoxin system